MDCPQEFAAGAYFGIPLVPLRGEALASFIARWLMLIALPNPDLALAAVMGGHHRQLSMSLPCRLEWIRSHFSAFARMSHREMVISYTSLPLYRPFMPAEKWENIAQQLGSEATSKSARARLGLLRPRHEKLAPMHCRQCMLEQVRRAGLPYWVMRFALPYVVACPDHGAVLEQFPLVPVAGGVWNRWLGIPVNPGELKHAKSVSASQAQVRISRLAMDLQSLNISAVPGELLAQTYAQRMREHGFGQSGGRINRRDWAQAAKEYWGELELAAPQRSQPWWTRAMHTKVGAATASPLHHLLMIGVLFGRVSDWRVAVERNRADHPASREDIQSRWLAGLPLQGARQVQLRVWVSRGTAPPACAADGPLPTEALELLKTGRPVSHICEKTGLSRSLLYRRLWANEELAKEWALAALRREIRVRFQSVDAEGISGSGAPTVAANQSWLYRHASALALLQDTGMLLPPGEQKPTRNAGDEQSTTLDWRFPGG